MSERSLATAQQRSMQDKRPGSMIRVPRATHDALRTMADDTGQSMQEILVEAVDAMRRRRMLEMTNAAYAVMRDDAAAWQAETAERQEWDVTLADGMQEE